MDAQRLHQSTMMLLPKWLASLRITLVAIPVLALSVLMTYRFAMPFSWLVESLLMLLGTNLVAAMVHNRAMRKSPSLAGFHLGLILITILCLLEPRFAFEGRAELAPGQSFSPRQVSVVKSGAFHQEKLGNIDLVQGPVRVEYHGGLQRGQITSSVVTPDATGRAAEVVIQDTQPLTLQGYKFYPTQNKGFSAIVEWRPNAGSPELGAVNFPSYPRYAWKQVNQWRADAGRELSMELMLPSLIDPESSWVLSDEVSGVNLQVKSDGALYQLEPGEMNRLPGGDMLLKDVGIWMGYRVTKRPVLPWLLLTSLVSIGFLGWHFHKRFSTLTSSGRGFTVDKLVLR